jgi:hypothetical protein
MFRPISACPGAENPPDCSGGFLVWRRADGYCCWSFRILSETGSCCCSACGLRRGSTCCSSRPGLNSSDGCPRTGLQFGYRPIVPSGQRRLMIGWHWPLIICEPGAHSTSCLGLRHAPLITSVPRGQTHSPRLLWTWPRMSHCCCVGCLRRQALPCTSVPLGQTQSPSELWT